MTDLIRTLPLNLPVDTRSLARVSVDPGLSAGVRAQLAVKRAFDIVAALLGLVLVAPVLAVVALLVRLDSPGGALFRQTRVGVGGRRFRIVKFRTMVQGAEAILALDPELLAEYERNNFKLASEADPRITGLGRFLRQTSLDELPQLWNVLRGEMSLVGPRPLPENHFDAFGEKKDSYLSMRPGITGYWQVAGRSAAGHAMPEMTDYYVRNWSLWLDAQVLAKTVPAVLARHGAH